MSYVNAVKAVRAYRMLFFNSMSVRSLRALNFDNKKNLVRNNVINLGYRN